MTTVYLIRHSVKYSKTEYESFNGKNDKDLIDEKAILSVLGEKRAEILCNKSDFDNVDIIYTSDMSRSMATAKYLATRLNKKINIDARFNERKYGKQNGDDFPDWYERQYLYEDFKTEGGESQKDVRNRFLDGLNEILKKYSNKNVAIFSHGYAITFTLLNWCKLINVDRKRKLTFEYNGKIIYDKILNSPEVFKLTFNGNELLNIECIEYEDLPYIKRGV